MATEAGVVTPSADWEPYWFPGRWVGGVALVLGPCLLLAGVLLRLPYPFFFPAQLAAYLEHPAWIGASYGCFAAGNVLLCPAVVTLARLIGARRPGWATWGGTLALFGLLARTFHAGVDHLAFQLARLRGPELATEVVASSYGAFHVFRSLSVAILSGWIVLAIGAYRSGTLGLLRSVALGLMAMLMIGVLKGSDATSVIATSGLCVALVPLGIRVLGTGPTPSPWAIAGWAVFFVALIGTFFLLGELG